MGKVCVLDCTLREAPLDGLQWGELSLHKMVHDLGEANIEYIECGFLKDVPHEEGSAYFNTVEQIKNAIGEKRSGTKYVALVDYGKYDLQQLTDNDGTSIDMIRVCFKKEEVKEVISYVNKIREKGYLVSIQHVNTISYSKEELADFIKEVNKFAPFAYAIVDTFGSMYTDELIKICQLVDSLLDKNIVLGFHAHNNIMLANANGQAFITEMKEKRDLIVDASLFGCGRGAGNANTELITEYLNRKNNANYDIDILLDLIDTVINAAQKKATWGYTIPYFISGINDTHSFNVKYLTQRHNIRSMDLRAIIEMLDEKQKKKYDYELLDTLYMSYFDNPVDDKVVKDLLKNIIKNRRVLLLAPGKTLVSEQAKVNRFIMQTKPVVIGVNNLIANYKQDIVFFSSIRRYELLPYQNLEEAGNPMIIKTSNIKKKVIEKEIVVDYGTLIKTGWTYLDSSIILLLRFLAKYEVKSVAIAGLDGYKNRGEAFYSQELETGLNDKERKQVSLENMDMLRDFHKSYPDIEISFLTQSNYSFIFDKKQNGNVEF